MATSTNVQIREGSKVSECDFIGNFRNVGGLVDVIVMRKIKYITTGATKVTLDQKKYKNIKSDCTQVHRSEIKALVLLPTDQVTVKQVHQKANQREHYFLVTVSPLQSYLTPIPDEFTVLLNATTNTEKIHNNNMNTQTVAFITPYIRTVAVNKYNSTEFNNDKIIIDKTDTNAVLNMIDDSKLHTVIKRPLEEHAVVSVMKKPLIDYSNSEKSILITSSINLFPKRNSLDTILVTSSLSLLSDSSQVPQDLIKDLQSQHPDSTLMVIKKDIELILNYISAFLGINSLIYGEMSKIRPSIFNSVEKNSKIFYQQYLPPFFSNTNSFLYMKARN